MYLPIYIITTCVIHIKDLTMESKYLVLFPVKVWEITG
jgi:hypothetical protein